MSQNQREQDILSYRPSIEFQKIIKTSTTQVSDSDITPHSPVVLEFQQYAPHKVGETIQKHIDTLKQKHHYIGNKLKHLVVNQMTFKEYQLLIMKEHPNLDELEQMESFESVHIPNIEGDMGVEVHKHLWYSIQTLQKILDYFYTLSYGTDAPSDAVLDNERAIVAQIVKYDEEGQKDRIKYDVIAVDTQLGKTMIDLSSSYYTFGLNIYNDYVLGDDALMLMNEIDMDAIIPVFEKLTELCLFDESKTLAYGNRQLIPHLFSKLQKQRREMIDVRTNRNGLAYVAQSDAVIRDMLEIQSVEIFAGLSELVKFSTSTEMYLDDFEKTIKEKEVIRRIYKSQL